MWRQQRPERGTKAISGAKPPSRKVGLNGPDSQRRLTSGHWSNDSKLLFQSPIGVSSHVGRSPCRTNDSDIGPLTRAGVENEKCIRPRFDAGDDLLAGPFTSGLRIPQARFFPRSPGHTKTLGLRQKLIYLQCHILALPETRSLALFCLRGTRPPCFRSVKAIRPKRIRTGLGQ